MTLLRSDKNSYCIVRCLALPGYKNFILLPTPKAVVFFIFSVTLYKDCLTVCLKFVEFL